MPGTHSQQFHRVFSSGFVCVSDDSMWQMAWIVGSTTKSITAVSVLQLVDSGAFTLDTPAHQLIDPVLQPQCGFTMAELWAENSAAIQTVRNRPRFGLN